MQLIIGILIGIFFGALLAYVLVSRRSESIRGQLALAKNSQLSLEDKAKDLQDAIERERANHEVAIASLKDSFRVLSFETLDSVVKGFNESQQQALAQREQKLDERMTPLQELLKEYKQKVEVLELNRETGFNKVEVAAQQLLEKQFEMMQETKKLNTILGRSGDRGQWGEIQLERILELSGMKKYVDFDPQLRVKSQNDSDKIPDVVVHLPHGANIAVDSKVPLDAFERGLNAQNDDERLVAMKEHAAKVRDHVKALAKKDYAASLPTSPSFVICFLPSDHLLSAAFDADPTLLQESIRSRVLVAGPTTLLGLLWSVWLGWSQFEQVENIDEIYDLASRIAERTATLYDHMDTLGKGITNSVKGFNSLVGSMETQLLVTVRQMQQKGVHSSKDIDDVDQVSVFPRPLEKERWPIPPVDEPLAINAEIVESTFEL